MKISAQQLVDRAMAEIETLSVEQTTALLNDPDTVFIDIRDIRELQRAGKIPGATHAPRGMLEFWADPESEYHRDFFSSGKRLLLYCAKSHRSALAAQTLQNMGFERVCHIGGGFEAWTGAEPPVEPLEKK